MASGIDIARYFVESPHIKWDDVGGLVQAKQVLLEKVIHQVTKSSITSEAPEAERNILLFAAVGCGKTYLSRSIASKVIDEACFIAICASDLISKFLVDSSRTVEKLFDEARHRKPAVVVIDDVDLLYSYTESVPAMQNMKALLNQLKESEKGIITICATSKPWTMPDELLECFGVHIYLPLPEEEARASIFKIQLHTSSHTLSQQDIDTLAAKTAGFSGADISIVVRDALLQPVRKVQAATHFKCVRGPSPSNPSVMVDDLLTPCSPEDSSAIAMTWMDLTGETLLEPVVCMGDMLKSLSTTKPTVRDEDIEKLKEFSEKCAI